MCRLSSDTLIEAPFLFTRRRDLAVILLHGGEPGAARAELRAYMSTPYFKDNADPYDKVTTVWFTSCIYYSRRLRITEDDYVL